MIWKGIKFFTQTSRIGFRYTTLLSDGDSKTYKHLCALNVYGVDTVIVTKKIASIMTTSDWGHPFESCPLKARRRESLLGVEAGKKADS